MHRCNAWCAQYTQCIWTSWIMGITQKDHRWLWCWCLFHKTQIDKHTIKIPVWFMSRIWFARSALHQMWCKLTPLNHGSNTKWSWVAVMCLCLFYEKMNCLFIHFLSKNMKTSYIQMLILCYSHDVRGITLIACAVHHPILHCMHSTSNLWHKSYTNLYHTFFIYLYYS